ncbi:dTMP kinase [Periweissella fabalis]|uniref:Thymidylate kinase n=1 Tax=Periweissella fabalis TaxID=1070421 RepID=A0A7X6S2U0_9LACO|nr:dTMP kinase [Periweissella fabalis]MCM0598712.1 dTMP kinase [Periweissella fabalis]NKZ24365.1 dTMP kinase [Periweissella fabalis]
MAGIFITFEGPDGAGKTSVLNEIITKLSARLGPKLVVTREPGGTQIAEAIRNVILDTQNTEMDARTEALLFAAARRQHIREIIQPALDENKFVFCDRFVDSSVAYQGAGRQIGADEVWQMNKFATEGLMPNLTLYFDVPSEVGLARIQNFRADEINRLDQASLSFHKRVREAYLNLQATYPQRIILIDAAQPFENVVADALEAIILRYPELNL